MSLQTLLNELRKGVQDVGKKQYQKMILLSRFLSFPV